MFNWVQFRGTGWKPIDMQSWVLGNKRLDFLSSVNRRIIPDQHNRAGNMLQHMLQEFDHLLTCYGALIQFHTQSDSVRFRADQQCPDQIGPLMMIQTRGHLRRLAARGPSALDRANQRFATFIEKNKGCAQRLPVFLSTASDSVSNKRLPPHRVETRPVVAFGNSTSSGRGDTKHYWLDTPHRITYESIPGHASRSSNHLNNHKPLSPELRLAPNVSVDEA